MLVNGSKENNHLAQFIEKLGCQQEYRLTREFSTGKALDILVGQNLIPSNHPTLNYSLGIGCSGAIINELIKDLESTIISVEKVTFFSLFSSMQIDVDSLYALGIFDIDDHPNTLSIRSKEGFSIFNMLNFTKSTGGRKTLSNWLRRPLIEKLQIDNRLENVEFFVRLQSQSLIEEFWTVFRKTKNISLIFSNLSVYPKVSDLENLYKYCKSVNQLMRILNETDCACKIVSELKEIYLKPGNLSNQTNASKFEDDSIKNGKNYAVQDILSEENSLIRIEQKLIQNINFDKSFEQNRITFKRGVNANLDRMKGIYDALPQLLGEATEEVVKELHLDESINVKVIYFPQIGYLISLPTECQNLISNSYEIVKTSLDAIYLKNQKMYLLDSEFGDIHTEIIDIEIELLQGLMIDIITHREKAVSIAIKLHEIDAIISLAQAAKKHNLVRPIIIDTNEKPTEIQKDTYVEKHFSHKSNDLQNNQTELNCSSNERSGICPIIEAVNCRHPLLEFNNNTFIPNDISLDTKSIRILTGPNCSGKSVYLKQIGILCIMAQSGSFIPAEYAKISIVDKIFTKISTKESISHDCSSFQSELDQMLNAIKIYSKNSLLLVDEFGKGTEASDGVGLFCSVLQHFTENLPMALFTTHYYESYDFLTREDSKTDSNYFAQFNSSGHNKIQWLKMSVELEENVDNVVFLHSIKEGICTQSLGTACAKLAGVPSNIIERAKEISYKHSNYLPIEPENFEEKSKKSNEFCNLVSELIGQYEEQTDKEASEDMGMISCCGDIDEIFDTLSNFDL